MKRPLTNDEQRLLQALVDRAKKLDIPQKTLESVLAEEMDDGGMGSLSLFLPSISGISRQMKSQASELQFVDADGVVVIASLNINEDGVPYEIDLWKTNFNPLIRIPLEFVDVEYSREQGDCKKRN